MRPARVIVLAVWLLVAVGTVVDSSSPGSEANNNVSLPGTDNQTASDVLAANFPKIQYSTNPIVLKAKSGKLTDSRYQQAIDDAVCSLRKSSYVNSATSPLSSGGAGQLSKGQTIGYISLALNIGTGDLAEERAQSIIDRADPAKKAGLQVAVGASLGQAVSKIPTGQSDIIGLAVGIDYALFLVTKHRTEVAEELEVKEAIARAIATAGGAVLFAGGTVAISLLALWVADVPLVTALGWTSAIAVVMAILAALTLLPALFGLLGRRVMSLQLPWGAHRSGQAPESGI